MMQLTSSHTSPSFLPVLLHPIIVGVSSQSMWLDASVDVASMVDMGWCQQGGCTDMALRVVLEVDGQWGWLGWMTVVVTMSYSA